MFWVFAAFLVSVPQAPLITKKGVVTIEDGHVSFSFHHVHFVLCHVTLLFCLPEEVIAPLSSWNTSLSPSMLLIWSLFCYYGLPLFSLLSTPCPSLFVSFDLQYISNRDFMARPAFSNPFQQPLLFNYTG